ncbi:hypothetical protein EJ04DRAFT_508670 [Polyplosphaeria fusca]|uniref:Methyltransferase n=1 Tax=Polyplosphaeria fusca TaxID=682080 RepID=A0A9P4R773_9PLEO|nr:hypothetical protein EJ04DRAFT_508670 [Polyplosphaeria fusca]
MVVHQVAKFHYLRWDDKFTHEKPYSILSGISDDSPVLKSNVSFEENPNEETITDMREAPHSYSLDTHGFNFHQVQSSFANWFDREQVESVFIPQVVEPFLKKHVPNAHRIVVFNWRLRRNICDEDSNRVDLNDGTHPILPARAVHIDQTPAGVVRRVRHHLGKDEANKALKGRVRLINFWKPLRYPVRDAPLAICDGSVVRMQDLIGCDLVKRTYTGETAFILPNPLFRWYYLSDQREDEALIFKMFDSDSSCPARSCPHAAFTPSKEYDESYPRESIEVRALILSDV